MNDKETPPTKKSLCKYGYFVPASATNLENRNDEISKDDECIEKSEKILSKDIFSDECQIISQNISTQNESSTKGNIEIR